MVERAPSSRRAPPRTPSAQERPPRRRGRRRARRPSPRRSRARPHPRRPRLRQCRPARPALPRPIAQVRATVKERAEPAAVASSADRAQDERLDSLRQELAAVKSRRGRRRARAAEKTKLDRRCEQRREGARRGEARAEAGTSAAEDERRRVVGSPTGTRRRAVAPAAPFARLAAFPRPNPFSTAPSAPSPRTRRGGAPGRTEAARRHRVQLAGDGWRRRAPSASRATGSIE